MASAVSIDMVSGSYAVVGGIAVMGLMAFAGIGDGMRENIVGTASTSRSPSIGGTSLAGVDGPGSTPPITVDSQPAETTNSNPWGDDDRRYGGIRPNSHTTPTNTNDQPGDIRPTSPSHADYLGGDETAGSGDGSSSSSDSGSAGNFEGSGGPYNGVEPTYTDDWVTQVIAFPHESQADAYATYLRTLTDNDVTFTENKHGNWEVIVHASSRNEAQDIANMLAAEAGRPDAYTRNRMSNEPEFSGAPAPTVEEPVVETAPPAPAPAPAPEDPPPAETQVDDTTAPAEPAAETPSVETPTVEGDAEAAETDAPPVVQEPTAVEEPTAPALPDDLDPTPSSAGDGLAFPEMTGADLALRRGEIEMELETELQNLADFFGEDSVERMLGSEFSIDALAAALDDGGSLAILDAESRATIDALLTENADIFEAQERRESILAVAHVSPRPSELALEVQALQGESMGVLAGFSDEDLGLARAWTEQRLQDMTENDVLFDAGTHDELAQMAAMDALMAQELATRGADVVRPGGPSMQLQMEAALVKEAFNHIGIPYVTDADGPNSFDCSGLTRYVYQKAVGIDMVSFSETQLAGFQPVGLDELRPGDIVGRNWEGPRSGHVVIYIGNGEYVHAPAPGKTVTTGNSLQSKPNDYKLAVRPTVDFSDASVTEAYQLPSVEIVEEDLATAVYMSATAEQESRDREAAEAAERGEAED